MKRLLLSLAMVLALAAPSFAAEDIVVGVTPFPHKDIMLAAKPLLAKEGYNLVIKEFTDYVQPNMALASKQLFANFFQHEPYLDNMNKEKKLDLVSIGKVHIEPLGVYSKKIKKLADLKKGNSVSVPNDPTNEARALRLLEANGVIAIKPGALVTVADITKNPLGLKFHELDAAQLPRTLDDVTASVINTNFAGEAGLVPSRDALVMEGSESPYANIIVVRSEDKDSPKAKALMKAVQSPEVKEYIQKNLVERGIVPVF
ncbi:MULTISPECIES: MetQ/NlpA family ABC transporter substrate-binding protein [Desulfovibrio]|jgi:ABC-type metal ion transport system, periplasmic component/surface antigen|uniref:MetQ/NlpA family ABC transporter substrate-binding protein n=1 Tax=Desulfovibrio TaxID=872 RepID=UPI0017812A86|nr:MULTISPECIES: MetQ/NlpA family ABC transporter substrate-binding protein [Desulfovibrio]MBD8894565.1 MetQ/NlpA family ABC transporter substrate-binding protein [Desulfovibrio desulfuricans]MBT9749173.1 methionine ABC transporter substrate-binding protein [Desulfovibrio desulfuricans]UIA99080.1 MetQ/NlpA family ABC transporter substrate-binding protein [Desulfovibrio desulfuricans]